MGWDGMGRDGMGGSCCRLVVNLPILFERVPLGGSLAHGVDYLATHLLVERAALAERFRVLQVHQTPDGRVRVRATATTTTTEKRKLEN